MLVALTTLQEKLLRDNSRTFLMAAALTHISSVLLATSGDTAEDATGERSLSQTCIMGPPGLLGTREMGGVIRRDREAAQGLSSSALDPPVYHIQPH